MFIRSIQGFGEYRAGENHILIEPLRHRRSGTVPGVIVLHGLTANSSLALDPLYGGGVPRHLARAGFVVLSIDAGDTGHGAGFGGPAVDAAVTQGIAFLHGKGVRPGPVAMVGLSMGAFTALKYAADHPGAVQAVWGGIPLVDLPFAYDAGLYNAQVNAAYGGDFGADDRAATNLVARAAQLQGVDILLHGATNDPVASSARVQDFVSATGCGFISLGAVGHDYNAMDNQGGVVADFLANAFDWELP